jgi:hypothetical protein
MADVLSSRQLMMIGHIIASSSNDEACRWAKISKGTLYAWLKDRVFLEELKRQRDAVVKASFDRLQLGMSLAVNELLGLLKTDRPELKRLVCRDVLDFSMKSREFERIEDRLDEIEKVLSKDRGCK